MNTEIKTCYICSDDPSVSSIYLPDQTPVVVGRSPETKITNIKCSRNQVRLYANYAQRTVFVQQLGHNACGLNGFKTERGSKLIARHGDILEIIYGQNSYCVEFNPHPPDEPVGTGNAGKKRIISDSEDEEFADRRSSKKLKKKENSLSKCAKKTEENSSKDGHANDPTVDMDTMNIIRDSIKDCEISEGAAEKPVWEEFDSLMIYTSVGVDGRSKVAAYDMDNTLIKTMSGRTFPRDHSDWQILHAGVPKKLQTLHTQGFKIVIFTNQGGMYLGKVKPSDFKLKIERIVKKLNVPIQVFIATGKDIYRKPRIGMWEKLQDKNDGVAIDKSLSFFVGDAAGRPKDWTPGQKKDHSMADRLLAMNLGINFYTPEEHFLGHKPAPYVMPGFDPKKTPTNVQLNEPPDATITSTIQEVVLMVGSPGSGKTHFAKTHLSEYHYVNRDKLGSWQKCAAALDDALAKGKSVVIDNTNPDVASRKRFIDVAKSRNIPVRCFVMSTDKEHARHNNRFRELTDSNHMTVSDVIINSYSYTNSTLLWRCLRFVKLLLLVCLRLLAGMPLFNNVEPYRKNYVAPNKEIEGFAEIVRINFVPRFKSDEHRRLYEMYLLEK